jgi:hypothetical protein
MTALPDAAAEDQPMARQTLYAILLFLLTLALALAAMRLAAMALTLSGP